jgi:hypothetical protein
MNEQRAFWISGLGSLAVVVLLGSALWARSKPAESNFSAIPPVSASVAVSDQRPPDQDPLRQELEVAYSDLDTAYREIERLRAAGADREGADHDDNDHDDDHEGDDDDEEGRGDRYASESEKQQ